MTAPAEWVAKWDELGLALQRTFWKPLRNMMDIFHMLPLAAVALLFVLLATDGQFRELYISYLEGPHADDGAKITVAAWSTWLAGMVAALAAIGLISAVLYEAHYALSTMRLNVVYSSYSNPDSNSRLRSLQKAAAFVLAFLPWFGLAIGLFNARNFVVDRYCQLLNGARVDFAELTHMQHLWVPNDWTIAGAFIFLGAAAAYFSSSGEQNRIAQLAVAWCAPPLAALLFLLVTDLLANKFVSLRLLLIGMIVLVVTVIYYLIYRWLHRRRAALFRLSPDSGRGISLRKRRRRWFAMWAFLPWFLLGAYFAGVQYFTAAAQIGDNWPDCPLSNNAVPGLWAAFPVAMCFTIAIGLLVGHALGRFSTHEWRRHAVVAVVVTLIVVFGMVACFGGVNRAVLLYRFIGPLGTVSLQLLFLISTFALLTALSQRSGFPALTLIVLALIVALMFPEYVGATALALGFVCVVFALMAAMSHRFGVAGIALLLPFLLAVNFYQFRHTQTVGQNPAGTPSNSSEVAYKFACWLNQRGVAVVNAALQHDPDCIADPASPDSPRKKWTSATRYPVFIIAAEGGGIYAASAASVFLARLQTIAPGFDDHVFAVSGVSGGSIGAAVFQALDHASHPDGAAKSNGTPVSQTPSCPPSPQTTPHGQSLEDEARNIMEDDHFSPVVGTVFPEMFGAPLSRPDALVASFEYSAAAQDTAAAQALCAAFDTHWSAAGFAPALVLNSTWVELGSRVAFSPFRLNDLDESLYSFSDPSMPDEANQSLMQAAGVSARFPLIMPPFSAVMEVKDAAGDRPTEKRWNFVDGAYSDNSGALSALDIYKALENVAPQNVDLRLILITSSTPQPDLTGTDINGTVFRDTIAPVDALMKVREGLGDEAVARACTYVYQDDPATRSRVEQTPSVSAKKAPAAKGLTESNDYCVRRASDEKSPLYLVEIQDQTYGLSLGWKISKTSFDVVSWMLGDPAKCLDQADLAAQKKEEKASDENVNAQLSKTILRRNSCIQKTIKRLVDGSSSTPAGTSSDPVTR